MTGLLNEPGSRRRLVAGAVDRALPTVEPLADSLVRLVDEKEMSRLSFLKTGGALVVGFTFAGSLLKAGSAKAATESISAAVTAPWPPRPWIRTENIRASSQSSPSRLGTAAGRDQGTKARAGGAQGITRW